MCNIWEIMTAIGTCTIGLLAVILTTVFSVIQNRHKILIVFNSVVNLKCPNCKNPEMQIINLPTDFSNTIRVQIINLGAKYIVVNSIKIIGGQNDPVDLSLHGTTDNGEGFPLCIEPGGIKSIQFYTEKLRSFIPLLGDQQINAAKLIKAHLIVQSWKKPYVKIKNINSDFAERLIEWLNNNPKKHNNLE